MAESFKLNYENTYEINITPESDSPTWAPVAAGIKTVEPNLNEKVSDDEYYDGEGFGSSDVTGGQLVHTFRGDRKYGDAAQDYICGLLMEFGDKRRTQMRWTQPDNRVLTGDVTIANIVPGGGEAGAKGGFGFEARWNGKPTASTKSA